MTWFFLLQKKVSVQKKREGGGVLAAGLTSPQGDWSSSQECPLPGGAGGQTPWVRWGWRGQGFQDPPEWECWDRQ